MFHWPARTNLVTGVALLGFLGTVPAPPPPAGSEVVSSHVVSNAVAATLVDAADPVATYDDSDLTECMGDDPEPIAYRNDRIVLRTWMGEADAANKVRQALNSLGSNVPIADVETITLPNVPVAAAPRLFGQPETEPGSMMPVVSVTFEVVPGEPVPIVALARRLRDYPIDASPDYLLSPTAADPSGDGDPSNDSGPTETWPNGFPVPTALVPPSRAAGLGGGIKIVVYDTGLPPLGQFNRPPNVTRLDPRDVETLDALAPFGVVDIYSAGHTVAIASVINTMAPGASVEAARITEAGGFATDWSAAKRMATSLRGVLPGHWPDVIVGAFGSPVCDVDPDDPGADMPPLGLQAVAEAVDRHDEALTVVSAGNRSTNRPFYPAAFSTSYPSVVAVGALDTACDADANPWTSPSRSGPPADFSNHGAWVTAWAPGVGLAVNHVSGFAFEEDGLPIINGQAIVDGTSFSAPLVAALIADQMVRSGKDAAGAWADIAGSGAPYPDGGGGVAVALTGLGDKPTVPVPPAALPIC